MRTSGEHTGISVKIAIQAVDIKHTTEIMAKPATCIRHTIN